MARRLHDSPLPKADNPQLEEEPMSDSESSGIVGIIGILAIVILVGLGAYFLIPRGGGGGGDGDLDVDVDMTVPEVNFDERDFEEELGRVAGSPQFIIAA
jgi:hypothetical protein